MELFAQILPDNQNEKHTAQIAIYHANALFAK